MRVLPALLLCGLLSACAWETYQDASGKTSLRPRYEAGTPVVYQDGTFARDQRYNDKRPVPVAVTREAPSAQQPVRGTRWGSGSAPADNTLQGEQELLPVQQ
ncbi:hypothetical protein L1281_000141 [Neisseria sp. HSC-16F19]|nr:hypothetical protein [Neisseria sp. HSC-16F19]MCP2039576.1 hypothetical protein [Neisseria sp. HSC-16F19]